MLHRPTGGVRDPALRRAFRVSGREEGGIDHARVLLGAGFAPETASRFVVGDAEPGLPWPKDHFDLISRAGKARSIAMMSSLI